MNIKIEEGIPVPQRGGEKSCIVKKLKVGDSFLADFGAGISPWHAAARAIGIKLCTRKADGHKVRIWRIK